MSSTFKGTFYIILASFFWGTMGVGAKYLMDVHAFVPEDLCTVRLIFGGLLTLLISFITGKGIGLHYFREKKNVIGFFLVGALIFACQLTFMKSVMVSTAGTATILLTTVPLWAAIWGAVFEHKKIKKVEGFCFLLATIGVILIVTKGNFGSLDMPILGVLWALASAIIYTCYSILSGSVVKRTGVLPVIGWGMLFGGLLSSFFNPLHALHGNFSWESILAFAYVVVFGTVLAFSFYMAALKYVSVVVAGLLICVQPLFAYIFQAVLLDETIGLVESLGILLIFLNVILLEMPENFFSKFTSRSLLLRTKPEACKSLIRRRSQSALAKYVADKLKAHPEPVFSALGSGSSESNQTWETVRNRLVANVDLQHWRGRLRRKMFVSDKWTDESGNRKVKYYDGMYWINFTRA